MAQKRIVARCQSPGARCGSRRLRRELERENAKLRKMCADLALRNDIIQTALEKGWGR